MDKYGTASVSKHRSGRHSKITANCIKNSVYPFDFYGQKLPGASIKKQGWNDGDLCPFYTDKKPGSFRINTVTGAFTCFACGTKGGDIIAFTMTLHGLSFSEALYKLADDRGLI
jgi:putative DNA primase/helicase